jgi:hypothetical protein
MTTLRGHHIHLRDPDNIAVELFMLEPDDETQKLLKNLSTTAGLKRTLSRPPVASTPPRGLAGRSLVFGLGVGDGVTPILLAWQHHWPGVWSSPARLSLVAAPLVASSQFSRV